MLFRLVALKGTDGQGITCYWFMIVPYKQFLLWLGNNILSPISYSAKQKEHHLASLIHYWSGLGIIENVSEERFLTEKKKISMVIEFDYTKEPKFESFWLGHGFEDCCQEDISWQNAVSIHIKLLKETVWNDYGESIEIMIDTLIRKPGYSEFIIDYPLTDKKKRCIGFIVFPGNNKKLKK